MLVVLSPFFIIRVFPILTCRSNIVVTKDRRYIKIMEFTPVNLALRAGVERADIIFAFAAALKAK